MSTSSRARGRGRRILARPEAPSLIGGDDMVSLTSEMSTVSISEPSDQRLPVIEMISRPNHGKAGVRIRVVANYYEMRLGTKPVVHRYDINIIHPLRQSRVDRDLCRLKFWEAVQNLGIFGRVQDLVYDDASTLYSKEKLNIPQGILKRDLTSGAPGGDRRGLSLEIQYTNSVRIDPSAAEQSVRAVSAAFLDCLITQSVRCTLLPEVSSRYYPYQRSVYIIPDPQKGIGWSEGIGCGIEAWRGLYGAVKIGENGVPMFNADVSTSVFYKIKLPIVDFYLEVLNEFKGRRRPFTEDDFHDMRDIAMNADSRQRLKNALRGLKLQLTYGSGRSYKFIDVMGPASTIRFELRSDPEKPGEEITVRDYFARHKGINLRFPHLPVLHIGPKTKNIFVPMELLYVCDTPQKFRRELTDFQKSQLIRKVSMAPGMRRNIIEQLITVFGAEGDEFLRNCGVQLGKRMVGLEARVLPPLTLALRENEAGVAFTIPVQDGSWRLCNPFAVNPNEGIIIGAVCVDNAINLRDFWSPYGVLTRACELFGVRFTQQNPLLADWTPGHDRAHEKLTRTVHNLLGESRGIDPKSTLHILFLMEKKDTRTYGLLKTVCDLEQGVSCQVILAKTFIKMKERAPETNSTAHNLALKLNAKLGGINNKVDSQYPFWQKFTNRSDPTIFVGVDVTHPPPGRGGNSIAAIVASVDLDATKYGVSIKVQRPNAERVIYLVDAMRDRLVSYFRSTSVKPNHIVIYRDGISESEFANALREEVSSVMAACRKLDPDYHPTITYIVVQKRHHTRFFLEKSHNERENIPPGTVVDHTVTDSELFDFFLCSHYGAMGTSRPSHYFVLYDSWRLSADEWQQASYALCHVYARCNKAVSIPAPVYYAHLACARASVQDVTIFGSGRRMVASVEGGSSQQLSDEETVRSQQTRLTVKDTTPRMYFV